MKLTEHFELAEFTQSDYAVRYGINNLPSPAIMGELRRVANVLETVRALCGNRALRITSGYRAPELNRAVGGAPNSAHTEGRAADFVVADLAVAEAGRAIAESVIEFDQLIYEGTWLHLAIPKLGAPGRRDILCARFKDGRATYKPWDLGA